LNVHSDRTAALAITGNAKCYFVARLNTARDGANVHEQIRRSIRAGNEAVVAQPPFDSSFKHFVFSVLKIIAEFYS
jgi:hypothetical protein